jgi:hypothetical protein
MKLKILYNSNEIKRQLPFIEKNVSHFKKNKMFFYFPFESLEKMSTKEIQEQICKDEKNFQIEKFKKKLEKEWNKKEKFIFEALKNYNDNENVFEFKKEYKCFLTFYGSYGYFEYPNIIFINVDAKIEFIMETIVHELIHLLIFEKMKNKSYLEIEKKVDKIFINSGIGKIFPNYKIQDI